MAAQGKPRNVRGDIDSAVTQVHKQIDSLAREYQNLMPGDPRREQIANEISSLNFEFEKLKSRV